MNAQADPYHELLALTRREHELIVTGDIASLASVQLQREQLIALLPQTPPQSAKPALMEAAAVQASTHKLLLAEKERLASELATTGRSQDTARGYGRSGFSAPASASFVRSA